MDSLNKSGDFHRVKTHFEKVGLDHIGFSKIQTPYSMEIYKNWIETEFVGDLEYLKTHADSKENPQKLLPKAKTMISVAVPYTPHPEPNRKISQYLKIARYARGRDYHFWLKEKLNQVILQLNEDFPQHKFLCFTDSQPILEKDWGWRSQLGWIGKNSCLIHPKRGSLFLLGEIITDVDFEEKESLAVIPDLCGQCQRCVEACPTDAILDNRTLDATRCISYWTIESKKNPPPELRSQLNGWFFGCDICQTVCPWNEKAIGKVNLKDANENTHRDELIQELKFLLTQSNKSLMRHFFQTPLTRPGGAGLKRNALLVIHSYKIKELKPFLKSLEFSRASLEELKLWVLERL